MPALHRVRHTLARAVLAAVAAAPAHASDALRWQALFDATPRLPAAVGQAQVTTRTLHGGLVVEASDPVWRQRAAEAEALLAPLSAASAQQMKATMDAFNKDPNAIRMARGLEQVMDDALRATQRGDRPSLRSSDPQVDQLLRDVEKPPSSDGLPPIAAYRLESQRMQPNGQTFRRQLYEQRQSFARRHAELDAEPAVSRTSPHERLEQHRRLAQQQLKEAAALQAAAIDALNPSVQKMTALAQQAEARSALPAERVQAYSWLKGQIDVVDAIARTAIEDVGFWLLVRPADGQAGATGAASFVVASAEVDLRFDGRMMPMAPHYPRGRVPTPWPPASTPR